MTGFGSASADCSVGRLGVEIKSVNSRFFEFNPRLPDDFRWAEPLCREKLQAQVQRGKVDFRLSLARNDQSLSQTKINSAGLASALRLAHEIRADHPEIAPFSVSDLLRLPGVTQESQVSQEEWAAQIGALVDQALQQFSESRATEGQRLLATIAIKLGEIAALADQAQRLLPAALQAQQAKLAERLKEALSSALNAGDASVSAEQLASLEDRVRQEAAVFGLRIDIAEELEHINSERLINRLDDFLGNPATDPHGDPIPDRSGTIHHKKLVKISEMKQNDSGTISGVSEHSSVFLKLLEKLGLTLGTKITVAELIEFDGSIMLTVQSKELTISREVAKNILVIL